MTVNNPALEYRPVDIPAVCARYREIDCPSYANNIERWAAKVRQIGGEPLVLMWQKEEVMTLVAIKLQNPNFPVVNLSNEILDRAFSNAKKYGVEKPLFFDEKCKEVVVGGYLKH